MTPIYQHAKETIFKDSPQLASFLEDAKKSLKIKRWGDNIINAQKATLETKVNYLLANNIKNTVSEATLFLYGQNQDVGLSDANLKKWAAQQEFNRIAQELRKQSDIKLYLDEAYSSQNKTQTKTVKAQEMKDIVNFCIDMGDKLYKKDQNTDSSIFYDKCESIAFDRTSTKLSCKKYYINKNVNFKDIAKVMEQNYFCRNY